ncbi:hypothetical protein LTS08_002905 [Lithohypha guttulata]|nr:hypothetical protein LTS08_002905 [Lithohypha guttulata]
MKTSLLVAGWLTYRAAADITLSDLQPIAEFSNTCTQAYSTPIKKCDNVHFAPIGDLSFATCTRDCLNELNSLATTLQRACQSDGVKPGTIIAHAFQGDLGNWLCATGPYASATPTPISTGTATNAKATSTKTTVSSSSTQSSSSSSSVSTTSATDTATESSSTESSSTQESTTEGTSTSATSVTSTSTSSSVTSSSASSTFSRSSTPASGVGQPAQTPFDSTPFDQLAFSSEAGHILTSAVVGTMLLGLIICIG